jgi:hypothetical protein
MSFPDLIGESIFLDSLVKPENDTEEVDSPVNPPVKPGEENDYKSSV